MKKNNYIAVNISKCFIFLCVVFLSNCQTVKKSTSSKITPSNGTSIVVGAERIFEYISKIKDKQIAVLVNQTSLIHDRHIVDVFIDLGLNLKIIFAPEHGFRGGKGAGEEVLDGFDDKTGIPIFSLHGTLKKPTPEQLKDVDVLIFDIQDVGVRFYTYISSMHYLMEACAENSIPLIILDRPNPNGSRINGPVLDLNYQSFVGMHPIPLLHGMTVAEIALMINGEGWLSGGKKCSLQIVKIKNYKHSSNYSLPIPPSPNLPNDLSIYLYPSLGLFEGTSISVGRGSQIPFQVLGYPLKTMGDFSFTPHKIAGSWSRLNYAGETLYGRKILSKDVKNNLLGPLLKWYQKFKKEGLRFFTRENFFDKLAGGDTLRKQILAGKSAAEIEHSWQASLKRFKILRSQYLLYPE